jgi:beta-glucanase (GH16 family)
VSSDEFNGTSLSDGSLHLKLIEQPTTVGGKTCPYVSGLVNSNGKAQFTYGAFEARIYAPPSGTRMANWPSFRTESRWVRSPPGSPPPRCT